MKKYVHLAAALLLASSVGLMSMKVSAAGHVDASSKPKLHKGITLTIEDFFDSAKKNDPGRLAMERVARAWATHTHNHVRFAGHPNDLQKKMCLDAPAGNGPDLIGVPHDQVSQMTQCKVLAPVPAWAWSPSLQKKYIKAALQGTKLSGKYYAMPWAIETTGLWYNKALIAASAFKTSGKKPLAWSKLIPRLQRLTDPGAGRYGLGWKVDDFYFSYAAIANTGGYVFKYTRRGFDYNKIGLDSQGAIKGIRFLRDMSTAGKYKLVPTSFLGSNGYSQQESLFDSGKLAVWLTGPWAKENMVKGGVNFGFAPVPSIDGKHPAHPFSGLQVFSVNAFSKNKNESLDLLSYMTQRMQLPEFKTQGRIPVLKSVLNSRTVQGDPVSRGLAAAALSAVPMPNIPEMGVVWDPMAKALTLVAKGSLDPAAAAHEAVSAIRQGITKSHGG